MSTDLPTETLFAIFEYLPPAVLAQVARTSRRFRAVAERILYSNIVILESLPRTAPVPFRTLRCCESLSMRAHIRDSVRRVTIRWQTDPVARDQYEPFVQPALRTLNRTLRALPALEALDLAFGLLGVPVRVDTVLGGCHFPSLRLFALCGIGPGPIPVKDSPDGAALAHFLEGTPTVEQLILGDHYETVSIADEALPALCAFSGTSRAAASIVLGRPVQHLALVGQDVILRHELDGMAQGSVPVRTLDLSAISVTPNTLKDASTRLSTIEHLKIKFAFRHTLHHSFTGISILAGLSAVLGAFPVLHHLDLSETPAVSNMDVGSSLEEITLCQTWYRSCPSLQRVAFPSKTEWTLSPEHIWVSKSPPRYTRS